MWIMMYDCFFSIVSKDCKPDELLVRARRPGDIEKVWPDAKVTTYTKSDYLYRAVISKTDVKLAIMRELDDIDYPNFKSATQDRPLHDAYNRVWGDMVVLQPTPPYSGYDKKGRKR